MSEPYSDYQGYLRASLKWFLSLALLLGAIATLAFLACGPPKPEHQPVSRAPEALPQP